MEKKAHYDEPEFEVISFGEEDVIRTSGPVTEEGAVGAIMQNFNLY